MYEWTEEDMEESGFDLPEKGRHWAEVKAVKERDTKNGDNMWSLRFKQTLTADTTLCFDNLVFSPKGKRIAYKKLSMLGVEKVGKSYKISHKDELIGKRCYIQIDHEQEHDKNGDPVFNSDRSPKMRAVPDFHSDGFGYELDTGNQGEQASAPVASGNGTSDDIPF